MFFVPLVGSLHSRSTVRQTIASQKLRYMGWFWLLLLGVLDSMVAVNVQVRIKKVQKGGRPQERLSVMQKVVNVLTQMPEYTA